MSKHYNVLDLFCGAGGMSLGFKNAGFNIYGGIDFDKAAMATHSNNFNTQYHFTGDISSISDKDIKKHKNIDVIIGGPPCQGFSAGNRYKTEEEDPRNKLFFEFIRFVKYLKPKVFVIENVPQILTKDNGYAKNKICEITSNLGYNVYYNVLSANEYGVPQKRRRAFFIGIRNDITSKFSSISIKKSKKEYTVFDAISDLVMIENEEIHYNTLSYITRNKYQEYLFNSGSEIINNHDISFHNETVVKRIKHVPQGGNWQDVPEELWDINRNNRHSSAYKRLKFVETSVTIDTGHMNYFHPIFNRVPTVRESARIQSFPDSFIFFGNKTEQYRQVGNAVPPLLAYAIAKHIMEILHNE